MAKQVFIDFDNLKLFNIFIQHKYDIITDRFIPFPNTRYSYTIINNFRFLDIRSEI